MLAGALNILLYPFSVLGIPYTFQTEFKGNEKRKIPDLSPNTVLCRYYQEWLLVLGGEVYQSIWAMLHSGDHDAGGNSLSELYLSANVYTGVRNS